MIVLPTYASRELIAERLPLIFPEGTPNRTYCVRELAASTVFAALYIGAVEGSDCYLGPVHVYRMTVEQAAKADDADRHAYAASVLKKNGQVLGARWYADNTREPIRDETLRDGLVAIGAITRREDLPTTSGQPRYALKADFARLFDPALQDADLEAAIGKFQQTHLSKSALARVTIMRAGAAAGASGVLVTFPNGETRQLAPGPSSFIAQAVIEVFAKRFLEAPAVLWLSESGNKVVVRDDKIAAAIGLKIEADKNLPGHCHVNAVYAGIRGFSDDAPVANPLICHTWASGRLASRTSIRLNVTMPPSELSAPGDAAARPRGAVHSGQA